ncbi:hypothetical protein VTN77DRAFT_5947 [Rasamsonia byssochlamydoides]|uniref:uncharacterized protein n=1 Tax=Rasamsonia byssochlamydoides TaxID=89139 RepID=UPI00374408B4
MGRSKKAIARDSSQLSGKPLSQTLEPSPLSTTAANNTESGVDGGSAGDEKWVTSPDLIQGDLPFTPDIMYNLTTFLLGNPNVNSSHLFRADILFDSSGVLRTPQETERLFSSSAARSDVAVPVSASASPEQVQSVPAREIPDFELKRTVVRRLIPRNPRLDRPLDQTCHFYEGKTSGDLSASSSLPTKERSLYVYTPHISSKEDIPYYHPVLRSLAFLYEFDRQPRNAASSLLSHDGEETTTTQQSERSGTGTLSVHFVPFPASESFDPIPTRLERTLQALLSTHVRLARTTRPSPSPSQVQQDPDSCGDGSNYNPTKDNVIPRHLVQNTYSRLKSTYAADLCRDWVEETEPSKHVFEDLAITAFLIELWRSMYGVVPAAEKAAAAVTKQQQQQQGDEHAHDDDRTEEERFSSDIEGTFPGFVDVACGNGVLVYVLLMEGYRGWGFDARRRKTWAIFPQWVQDRLKESIYIPKPFADALSVSGGGTYQEDLAGLGVDTHTGTFPKDTFIISNHADELTVWTPLMAVLAQPASPLPFLAIPCCSHSLSGARYRYSPPKAKKNKTDEDKDENAHEHENEHDHEDEVEQNPQPATGDLKALRAAKLAASTQGDDADPNAPAFQNSMYGSLTAKTMSVAEELGYEVEKTLLRIPSTRNMGIIGGRRRTAEIWARRRQTTTLTTTTQITTEDVTENDDEGTKGDEGEDLHSTALQLIHRECAREGGIDCAARIWIQRAMSIHKGPGKGRIKGCRDGH